MRAGFVMLKPKAGCNADAMARSIASCRFVRKVFLTTGDYGFVVSVDADGKRIGRALRKIRKVSAGALISTAISHRCYGSNEDVRGSAARRE
ncbi:MAG: hypothetical protein KGH61_01100 [Candidatus Micrarchaeota archaeon]|nr:hypothetical protein [Candidatus Micrarchaeota archaeon]MDE1847530.1 hypothetical protein [Candidatus Micrarchaeota archaeon]MDE1863834.1 hypothetical protein [Candidatus Micrarchaeota archaeon]